MGQQELLKARLKSVDFLKNTILLEESRAEAASENQKAPTGQLVTLCRKADREGACRDLRKLSRYWPWMD